MSLNPSTERALNRLLNKMAKPPKRPPRRFSVAPLYMALGLVLAYQLLVRFVPAVWATALPGGLEQAETLRGWPGLVWRLGWLFRAKFEAVAMAMAVVSVGSFVAATVLRPLRLFIWLAAIAVIALDAGILIVTLQTALTVTTQAASFGGLAP